MGWTAFKQTVLTQMYGPPPPSSPTQVVDAIVRAYDEAVRTPPSGDMMNQNFVTQGNTEALKQALYNIFAIQSKSTVPLPIVNQIASAFPLYWTGAQLSTTNLPIPIPPVMVHWYILSNTVSNPGAPPPFTLPYGVAISTEQFVDNIILLARLHLTTVSGEMLTMAQYYPPAPVPIFAPGFSTWVGYMVED